MKKNLFAILLMIFAAVIAVGSVTVLGPCVHEDGSTGPCADAGRAMLIDGCVTAILAILVTLVNRRGLRMALFVAALCAAVIGILLPGVLMPLCKMDTMHCRAVMQPSMIILSGAAAVSALLGIITERSRKA